MGSVKGLDTIEKAKGRVMGKGFFVFSDDFSVFDFGKMPDIIPYKGASLAMMSAAMFETVKEAGVKTHYKGLFGNGGGVKFTKNLTRPSNEMFIDLVRVIPPSFDGGNYDYHVYSDGLAVNFLIPLEIIYRNFLPKGSSVFKRLQQGTLTIKDLGLVGYPKQGQKLKKPYFDVSTKLEKTDRYITWAEAQQISGLSDENIVNVKDVLQKCNNVITDVAATAGLRNEDGKIELAIDQDGNIIVVDVIGTPDECRFSFEGVPLSKEILRDYYRQTTWYTQVQSAKERAENEKIEDWKQYCPSPPPLPKELIKVVSDVYTSMSNSFVGKSIFDAPSIEQASQAYTSWKNKIA